MLVLPQRENSGERLPAGLAGTPEAGDPGEVATEVDGWGPALRALESGLTPQEVRLLPCFLSSVSFDVRRHVHSRLNLDVRQRLGTQRGKPLGFFRSR